MANDFVGIDVAGLSQVTAKISQLPQEAANHGVELANEYLVNSLRHYPPRVFHGTGNPYHWQSDKQRRAFFATKGFGRGIPTQRTQGIAQGWQTLGSGTNQIIVNEAEGAPFVVGDKIQRGHIADGWKKAVDTVKDKLPQVMRRFDAGVQKAIRKLRLG